MHAPTIEDLKAGVDPTPALILPSPAADAFAEAFYKMGAEVTKSLCQMADVMAIHEPPKNLPRDPSMRKDRRKWGGR